LLSFHKNSKIALTLSFFNLFINLTHAAHDKGREVEIFFTGKGVLLNQTTKFRKLVVKPILNQESNGRPQNLKAFLVDNYQENASTKHRIAGI